MSDAEKVQVWVDPGPKVCPSGPPVTFRVGGMLSIVTLLSVKLELPAASKAVARTVAAPSEIVAVLNEVL